MNRAKPRRKEIKMDTITVWKCKELYASFAAPRDVYFRTKEEAKAYMENNLEAFDLRKVTYKSEKKINEVLAELNKTEGST